MKWRDQSLGKKLGTIAFFVTEAIVLYATYKCEIKDLISIITAQTFILAIVWGSKAVSNFANNKQQ